MSSSISNSFTLPIRIADIDHVHYYFLKIYATLLKFLFGMALVRDFSFRNCNFQMPKSYWNLLILLSHKVSINFQTTFPAHAFPYSKSTSSSFLSDISSLVMIVSCGIIADSACEQYFESVICKSYTIFTKDNP